ncbi:subtilisin-like serine-protease S isoform X1 [Malus sylvestris]|uniref:subtilisin-like serine-protease S isoform X1 n=1 Tax=Malus sylvestris TaxID=3752 RepID=UPI0021AD456A|nr:subtilisin-like serine-protease S isoform X1 [Malus sylvestris]
MLLAFTRLFRKQGSLDQKKVVGKIVVCVDDDPAVSRRIKKLVVADTKAKGLILIDEAEKGLPFDSGIFPFTEVGNTAGFQILEYINSTKNLTATILPKVVVLHRLLHFFHPGVLHSLQKTFSKLFSLPYTSLFYLFNFFFKFTCTLILDISVRI